MPLPSKILVPVDFAPCSLAALDRASELAKVCGATLHVVHVRPAEGSSALGAATLTAPVETSGEAMESLEDLVERTRGVLGDRVAGRVLTGNPERVILETTAEGGYDLIVMGTHGRVGRLHMLAGSVAEAVIRSASCPVLVVREPG